jgi:hypothetical protein
MLSRFSRTALLALATTLAVGCAPSIKVNVLQPARYNLGASKDLAIVQTEGRRAGRDFIIDELIRQARTGGHFKVDDRSDEGIVVKVAGRSVQVVSGGNGAANSPEQIGIRIDVHDWDADEKSETVTEKDSKGNTIEREVEFYQAKVIVAVTAFNASGKALLAEREYKSTARGDNEDRALKNAGNEVISSLLYDITPRYVTKSIRMDDTDEAQKPIIQVAERGNVPQAVREMESYTQANPNNASALYNLAVLTDASGRYQDALDLYTRAITMASKDFYVDMKSECARRLSDQQALAE